jgi:hypothetical protein
MIDLRIIQFLSATPMPLMITFVTKQGSSMARIGPREGRNDVLMDVAKWRQLVCQANKKASAKGRGLIAARQLESRD